MIEDLLVVRDLERHFGGVRAVNGASFRVSRGTILGLIGPNGAGKSTVLSMIAGALRPTAGSIFFEGREITSIPPHTVARRGIIRTFQTPSEFDRLTTLENLLTAAPNRRGDSVGGAMLGRRWWRDQEQQLLEEAIGLLRRFDMLGTANEYAGDLSSGQQRLLELMRALMARPKLLLLDEPFAGVNPTLARRIERYISDLCKEGITIIMVEHEMGVIERLCTSIVVMAQGRVISEGTMAEIRTDREVLDAYLTG
jgi:branched-chain amino acid transport system ATP-binding protein/branched-chain amino acid transport system permease protein